MSKETILNQIEQLQKQLKELETKEKTNEFIKLLIAVLLDDNCTIILDGHTEWQFQEKYHMKDIMFVYRRVIAKSLQEIIGRKENEKK